MGTNKRYAAKIDQRVKPAVAWHPILDATELHPGYWVLALSSTSGIYATVRLVRRGGELGYRAENEAGELLGFYLTLQSAVFNAWSLTIAPGVHRD